MPQVVAIEFELPDDLARFRCTPHSEGPVVFLDFHRQGASLGQAIGSAVEDVERAGFAVKCVVVESRTD
jgi:hypothetical protein